MHDFERSAHLDSFPRDHLPPFEQWPPMNLQCLPEIAAYPRRMNCARELLDKQAAIYGDKPVIYYGDEVWSWNRLLETANRIAHVLVDDLGVQPGNRVLLRAPNNPMYVACWFAVMKVGAVAVATMPLYRWRELTYMTDKAEIKVALCDWRLREEMETTLKESAFLERCLYFMGGEDSLESRMAAKPAHFETCDTAWDDVCLIAFTSGTTGPAKGCMHFHRDVMMICDSFNRYVLKPGPDDIFTGSPPLAFTFGLGALVAFPMHGGGATLLVEQYTPETMLRSIEKYGVTILFTAPTAYRAMTGLLAKGGYNVGSLRQCVSAGETLPLPVWQGWADATGIKIIDGLGSTEMLHIFITSKGDGIRPGATGKPIPGYEACILDDEGKPVPDGTVGRLAVRGPTGVRYLDNPERQAAYSAYGWNLTGDSYLRDADGFYWYQARTDDMIISAGYNISGPEVEAVLLLHPDVSECAVVAAPDAERGHVVKAYVVLRDKDKAGPQTAKALQDFVKAEIAPYKYPRAVEFLDALPRTQTGKVQRFVLRQKEAGES